MLKGVKINMQIYYLSIYLKLAELQSKIFFSSILKIPLDNNSLYDFLDTKKSSNKNIIIDSSMQHMTYKLTLKYKKELNIAFTPFYISNADLFSLKYMRHHNNF